MSRGVFRNWFFTLNFEPGFDWDKLDLDRIKYMIVGEEHGQNGYHHFQGALFFKSNMSMSAVKTWLGKQIVHLERLMDAEKSIAYCSKEKVIFETGDKPGVVGQRIDLERFKEAIKGGMSELELMESYTKEMIRYPRFYTDYRRAIMRDRAEHGEFYPTAGVYIHGASGAGKSRMARQRFPGIFTVPLSDGTKLWMDGYNGEEAILFEDFDSSVNFRLMLRIMDVYPMQVEVKGGFVPRCWKTVVITSNLRIADQYPKELYKEPFIRRITETILLELPEQNPLYQQVAAALGAAHGYDPFDHFAL